MGHHHHQNHSSGGGSSGGGHHAHKHHHTPAYQAPSPSYSHKPKHHHSSGSSGPGFFDMLFGTNHAYAMAQNDADSTFRRHDLEAQRRAEREREAAREAARADAERANAERANAQLRARERQQQIAQRIEALRGMHRVALQPIAWESYRDQPDPQLQALAARVLARDELAFSEALTQCGCLVEVHTHVGKDGVRVSLSPTTGHVDVRAPLGDAVPTFSLQEGSPVRTMEDRLDIYQDYVCGLALRAARELLAVLPLDAVTVDIWNVTAAPPPAQSDAGAYREAQAPTAINLRIASMLCARAAMDVIPWGVADASKVVESLPHQMAFRPSEGFYEVPHVSVG